MVDTARQLRCYADGADKPAQLEIIRGKGHQMISGPAEARACMQFWAQHLAAPPPPAALGEEVVEVAT